MEIKVDIDFVHGEEVNLKTDKNIMRLVTGFMVFPTMITYELANGESKTYHQAVEIERWKTKKPGFK